MAAFDTNVVVRLLVQDDEEQCRRAEAALRRAAAGEGAWISTVVEDDMTVLRALSSFESGAADFADYVILEAARGADALPLQTFDERLARADGAERVG